MRCFAGFGILFPGQRLGTLTDRFYADPQLGEVVASVYENHYKDEPDDNVFLSRATLFSLGEKGFKVELDGGRVIEAGVEYAENTTNQMIGEFDTIDTTRIPVFDVARYDWKIAAGTCTYSFLEAARARGDSAKFALIEKKVDNERNSHFALLNRQFWNTSTPGSNEITSIPTIVSTTPTTGTVGGLNAASFSFWRNRQTSGAKSATAFDNLVSSMRSIFNQCSLGGVKMTPTAIITDRTDFEGYESTQQTFIRYMFDDYTKKGMDAGFLNKAINYKGTPLFYDEDAPSGNMYFLNNEVLKFVFLAGNWAKLHPAVDPANALLNVHKMNTFGNFACGARRHLGVVSGIT